jgi:hypothetical protein
MEEKNNALLPQYCNYFEINGSLREFVVSFYCDVQPSTEETKNGVDKPHRILISRIVFSPLGIRNFIGKLSGLVEEIDRHAENLDLPNEHKKTE